MSKKNNRHEATAETASVKKLTGLMVIGIILLVAQAVLSIAISLGMKSIDFKIFSALIVTVAILIPVGKKKLESMLSKMVKKNVVNASNGEEDNNA